MSSEAVSHVVLFFVVISLVGGVSVVGNDILETAKNEEALEQGVRGFTDVHQTGKRFTKIGSDDEFATSGVSVNVKSTNAELRDTPDTTIRINTGDTYELTTTPLAIDHDEFELYYDAGVISSIEYPNDTRTHWSPVNNRESSDGVLRLTTTTMNQSSVRETGATTRIFIEQARSPEYVTLSDGDTVTVETHTPHGWEQYLNKYDFLNVTSTTTTGDTRTITADVEISGDSNVIVHHQKVQLSFLD